MRRAIQILTVVYNVILIFAILSFAVTSVIFFIASTDDKIINEMIEKDVFKDPEVTKAFVKAFCIGMGVGMLFGALAFVVGLVFNNLIRMEVKHEFKEERKGKNIAYGVLAIVFGATATGILNIIYNAVSKEASKDNETLE